MLLHMVNGMVADMVADKEVDKVADMVAGPGVVNWAQTFSTRTLIPNLCVF